MPKIGRLALDCHETFRLHIEARRRAQKSSRIRMMGAMKQLVCRPRLDDLPRVQDIEKVTGPGDHPEVVSDQQERQTQISLKRGDQFEDLGLGGHVESRGRLVGDQHHGITRQRYGNYHSLLHAAGELERILTEAAPGVGDPNLLQQIGCSREGFPPA